jgi:hypothetical protein
VLEPVAPSGVTARDRVDPPARPVERDPERRSDRARPDDPDDRRLVGPALDMRVAVRLARVVVTGAAIGTIAIGIAVPVVVARLVTVLRLVIAAGCGALGRGRRIEIDAGLVERPQGLLAAASDAIVVPAAPGLHTVTAGPSARPGTRRPEALGGVAGVRRGTLPSERVYRSSTTEDA